MRTVSINKHMKHRIIEGLTVCDHDASLLRAWVLEGGSEGKIEEPCIWFKSAIASVLSSFSCSWHASSTRSRATRVHRTRTASTRAGTTSRARGPSPIPTATTESGALFASLNTVIRRLMVVRTTLGMVLNVMIPWCQCVALEHTVPQVQTVWTVLWARILSLEVAWSQTLLNVL